MEFVEEELIPLLEVILLGFVPGLFLIYQYYRISRKRQITLSAPDESRFTWRNPATLTGKDLKFIANIYKWLGIFILTLSTFILFSIIIP